MPRADLRATGRAGGSALTGTAAPPSPFLASLSLSPPVSPTDPVCSLVNLKWGGTLRSLPGRRPREGGTWPWAQWLTFLSAAISEREGGGKGSLSMEPPENLPARPPGRNTRAPGPAPTGGSPGSATARAAGDKLDPGGPPHPSSEGTPNPAAGPLGLLALHALGPPAGLVPLKVAGLSTPGIFTHQTGPVSSTHHKYAF